MLTLIYDRLTRAHTGLYLADKLIECLRSYKIQDKVSDTYFRCV